MSTDHRIRNSVIAGLIVAAVVAVAKFLSEVFPAMIAALGSALAGSWRHLTSTVDVPRGIIYPAALVGSIWAIRRIRRARKAAALSEPVETDWRDYREDRFLGVVWRWAYDNSGHPMDLYAFCPLCDLQLIPRQYGGFGYAADLVCARCEEDWKGRGTWRDTQIYVTLEVQRNLRAGVWRHRLR